MKIPALFFVELNIYHNVLQLRNREKTLPHFLPEQFQTGKTYEWANNLF
jgi:hypothetical protein